MEENGYQSFSDQRRNQVPTGVLSQGSFKKEEKMKMSLVSTIADQLLYPIYFISISILSLLGGIELVRDYRRKKDES